MEHSRIPLLDQQALIEVAREMLAGFFVDIDKRVELSVNENVQMPSR